VTEILRFAHTSDIELAEINNRTSSRLSFVCRLPIQRSGRQSPSHYIGVTLINNFTFLVEDTLIFPAFSRFIGRTTKEDSCSTTITYS